MLCWVKIYSSLKYSRQNIPNTNHLEYIHHPGIFCLDYFELRYFEVEPVILIQNLIIFFVVNISFFVVVSRYLSVETLAKQN